MLRLYGQNTKPEQVDPQQAAKFEEDAGRYWDLFYKRNSDRFFKDRHYFDKEWPQLTRGHITVLEVGCGAGNSVFPLLEINPSSYVYACDFSPRAVELVKAHPAYAETGRVSAFVADITQHEGQGALLQQLPGPVVDFCSMVFVLSAVAPHKMRQALRNVASVLKPGTGRVQFRDYADGDMAQTRLQDSQGVKHIRGNFYARGDGTCCYYFGQDELSALFASEGFVCEDSLIHARTIENRKSGVKMPRRWVQAVFRFDPAQQPPQPLVVSEEPQQQQQQQQEEHAPPQQQQNGDAQADPSSLDNVCASSSRGDDSCSSCVSCAGKTWLLPSYLAAVHAGSSSSSSPRPCSQQGCCICLAEALVALVQEQQLQLLGRCVLLAPSWLCIQQQQQQQLASGRQHLLQVQHVQQASQQSPCVVCCDQADSNRLRAAEGAQQAGGAAVALLALVAVWLGARRVYVCLPAEGGSRQHAAVSGATEAFSEAFHAVLGLNECRVVVERIRPKRWQQGDVRQAAAMQRELVQALERGLPACNGLVILAGASSAAACDSAGGSQQLLDAVCRVGMSPQAAPLQLVVCAPGLLPGGVGA